MKFLEAVLVRSHDPKAHSDKHATAVSAESITQQHLADESDINVIVRRFGITGQMPSGVPGGVYGDFSGVADYDSALAAIERAQEGFMTLPPEVRERFGNNPGMLIEYANGVPYDQLEAELKAQLVPAAAVVAAAVASDAAG